MEANLRMLQLRYELQEFCVTQLRRGIRIYASAEFILRRLTLRY
jgi:hypothetical protein